MKDIFSIHYPKGYQSPPVASCQVMPIEQEHPSGLLPLHTSSSPQLPEPVHRLLNAAYAAYGGAEHMTLDQWRDLEQQLKARLEHELRKH